MNSLKVLSAAAALALVLPMTSPSFAQGGGPGGARGGGGGGGGAAMGGGGGGASIGGGGGGGRMGGGAAFQGGGRGMGGGAAMRPSTGNFGAGPAVRPGGGGNFAGASRPGISPSYGGPRQYATGGNWRGGGGRHWNHNHRGGGFLPGFAAGAAIGGIGSYAYYGNGYGYGGGYYDDPYYYGSSYYDEPSVAVVQDGGGDSAYCAQRFKSYDPASGTYLGYDGKRHPCP